MHRCPRGNFYVVATWYHEDPERDHQLRLHGGGYLNTMLLARRISRDGHDERGRPDAIRIVAIDKI